MGTPALYTPEGIIVDVIQDGDEMAFVKYPNGKAIWVKSNLLNFEFDLDDDWGPENDDTLGLLDDIHDYDDDMDIEIDSGDHYDAEYDR